MSSEHTRCSLLIATLTQEGNFRCDVCCLALLLFKNVSPAPKVKALLASMQKKGCGFSASNISCEPCELMVQGYFSDAENKVTFSD